MWPALANGRTANEMRAGFRKCLCLPSCRFWNPATSYKPYWIMRDLWLCLHHPAAIELSSSSPDTRHLGHPARTEPALPSPHIRNQLTAPQGASKGICYLFLLPAAAAGTPIKPCLNFFSGLLLISMDWQRPRTLGDINITLCLCRTNPWGLVWQGTPDLTRASKLLWDFSRGSWETGHARGRTWGWSCQHHPAS